MVTAVSDAATGGSTPDATRAAETPPPLYYAIDPDALDSLFHAPHRSGTTEGQVSFSYWNFEVSVHASGRVEVRATGGDE